MQLLTIEEMKTVSGGLTWTDRRVSENLIDLRGSYAQSYYLGAYRPNPILQYQYFGTILPR